MPDIPYIEPESFVAGDTIKWKRSLSDYPATTHTLKYEFHLRSGVAATDFTITSSADGTDHSVVITAVVSAAYTAGEYEWFAYVVDVATGLERYSVGKGRTTIEPDPAEVATGTDLRTHAEIMLDAIEAMLEGDTTNQKRVKINDREIEKYTPEELLAWRNYYKKEVEAEQNAADIAAGKNTGGRYFMEI